MAAVNDTGSYEFTPEFENCGVDLSNLELSSDWDAAAKAITTWLEKQPGIAPCAIGTSAANGTASFSQLKPGLYLVSSASAVQGSYRYSTAPLTVALLALIATLATLFAYQQRKKQLAATAASSASHAAAGANPSPEGTQHATGEASLEEEIEEAPLPEHLHG